MPRGDGTGPAGMGPMTGRAAGYCAGYDVPGYMNPYGGRRNAAMPGGGFGRGRGYRHSYYATGLPFWQRQSPYPPAAPYYGPEAGPEDEVEQLKQHADALKKQLDDIQARMDELAKTDKEE
ncbi:MAG: DUF5320 domain-containing protein [Actinomycetota bacterium]